jgi:four helix bundle protein
VERTNFENLKVYQLSENLADAIWDIVLKWHQLAKDTVGKQVIRSSDSIGANIAEGSGRGSVIDNRRFARVARGSLYETKHWLRRAFRRKLLTAKQIESLRALIDDLTRTLNGYIRSLTPPKP